MVWDLFICLQYKYYEDKLKCIPKPKSDEAYSEKHYITVDWTIDIHHEVADFFFI